MQIQESIDMIEERCKRIHTADDFLMNADRMMVFDSCVMRLQAIGEQVGKKKDYAQEQNKLSS